MVNDFGQAMLVFGVQTQEEQFSSNASLQTPNFYLIFTSRTTPNFSASYKQEMGSFGPTLQWYLLV